MQAQITEWLDRKQNRTNGGTKCLQFQSHRTSQIITKFFFITGNNQVLWCNGCHSCHTCLCVGRARFNPWSDHLIRVSHKNQCHWLFYFFYSFSFLRLIVWERLRQQEITQFRLRRSGWRLTSLTVQAI